MATIARGWSSTDLPLSISLDSFVDQRVDRWKWMEANTPDHIYHYSFSHPPSWEGWFRLYQGLEWDRVNGKRSQTSRKVGGYDLRADDVIAAHIDQLNVNADFDRNRGNVKCSSTSDPLSGRGISCHEEISTPRREKSAVEKRSQTLHTI
ncbi:uncharacterized protein LY79DRAFT_404319 [Colletotrichum navitas]|uniref:Uncharacterized protein n=1 Tax=Colletotrichum navitas TaxID=681940 RepID=A0AAD8Q8A2_9PEZI|nr:uncharacterized protein LY79DRAFT_404319 [Colletotrichum navitas]KAK1597071.1 hypothetical protein LY79DRAFT_404319 [Colletotrichum navitas]